VNDVRLSATSIRDYLDCPRRFQLRYILEQPWPAAENEPLLEYERSRERGIQFHQLLERYYLGVDARTLSDMIADPIVRGWWQIHQNQSPVDKAASKRILPEKMFQARLDDHTLTAFLDLVVIGQDDSVTIIDWKTTQREPDPDEWSKSIQTLVYLYVVGEKIAALQGHAIPLTQIKMLYWFVEYPDEPLWINYSDVQHEQAKNKLRDLLRSLRDETEWPKTSDLKKCKFCVYRSLCDRGIRAEITSDFDEPEIWTVLDADLNE
jgi:CRISPR/Cas system-associated exonuclease Cas4 (RecB family)